MSLAGNASRRTEKALRSRCPRRREPSTLTGGVVFLSLTPSLNPTLRAQRRREKRQARKAEKPDKGPPRWQRELSKGSPRTTFAIGALLTLPGASYLAGLDQIQSYSPAFSWHRKQPLAPSNGPSSGSAATRTPSRYAGPPRSACSS
jgi:hypothetical protein